MECSHRFIDSFNAIVQISHQINVKIIIDLLLGTIDANLLRKYMLFVYAYKFCSNFYFSTHKCNKLIDTYVFYNTVIGYVLYSASSSGHVNICTENKTNNVCVCVSVYQ